MSNSGTFFYNKAIDIIKREIGNNISVLHIADELGINYYDKELLKLVSQSTGINEQMFSQVDEKLKRTVIWKVAQNVYRGENLGKQNEDYAMNISMFNYTARVLTDAIQSLHMNFWDLIWKERMSLLLTI